MSALARLADGKQTSIERRLISLRAMAGAMTVSEFQSSIDEIIQIARRERVEKKRGQPKLSVLIPM